MTMQTLSEKEWWEFTLDSVFTVDAGKRLETRNKIPGNTPFIGATDNNNGVTGFVGNNNVSKDKNVLGVNYNGAPCIAFYHPYDCLFTDDVKRLHLLNHEDNKPVLLSFTTIFAKQRCKYSYGYKFKEQRMLRQKLMLPINDQGEPDYDFMGEYASSKRGALLMRYREFLAGQLAELEYKEIPSLKEKEWQSFTVEELFDDIQSTKGKTTGQLIDGNDVPYIAAAKSNNGFVKMCSSKEFPEWVSKGNAIVFVQLGDGAAGLAHYVPMDFIGMSGKTSAGYSSFLNLYTGLFLAKCLSVNKEKFSHGHSWTGRRLITTQVMLPVNEHGEPDYEYMEQYTKNMMFKKYQQYLDYINRVKE